MNHAPETTYGQFCPVAISLDVLGDRWTILLLRDMLWSGALPFGELAARNPGLPTDLLTARLTDLERHGLVEQLDEPKRRWVLTEKGGEIDGIISALYGFGMPLVGVADVDDRMLAYTVAETARRRRLDLLDVEEVETIELCVGQGRACVEIAPGSIRVSDQHAPRASVTMGPGELAQIMAGMTDYAGHRASGMLEVHGDEGAAERVVNFFRPAPG